MTEQNYSYKPRPRRESSYEAQITKELSALGWLVLKTPLGGGFPDKMALRESEAVFIEFKAKGKNPSPAQNEYAQKLTSFGFDTYVLRDGDPLPDRFSKKSTLR